MFGPTTMPPQFQPRPMVAPSVAPMNNTGFMGGAIRPPNFGGGVIAPPMPVARPPVAPNMGGIPGQLGTLLNAPHPMMGGMYGGGWGGAPMQQQQPQGGMWGGGFSPFMNRSQF